MSGTSSGTETGLAGYWQFDALSGTDTAGADHGTLVGSPSWARGALPENPVRGAWGDALSFDGVNDYVDLANPDALNLTGSLTIEAWIAPDAKFGMQAIVGKKQGGAGNNGYVLTVNSWDTMDGRLVFETKNASLKTVAPVIEFGRWQHVAVTVDGTTARIYVDGIEQPTTGSVNLVSSDAAARLGSFSNAAGFYDGFMDNVSVWNVARTADEIRSGLFRVLDGSEPRLVGYWKFDEGLAATAADTAGGDQNGTLAGALWAVSTVPVSPPGQFGDALWFDGWRDYVSADSITSELAAAGAMTFSAWVYPEGDGREAILAVNAVDGANRLILFYDNGNQYFYYDDETLTWQRSFHPFAREQWHHVALTIGAPSEGVSPATLYVDGFAELSFNLASADRPQSGDHFSIGQEWDGGPKRTSDHWTGLIDEVRVWTVQRTKAQIQDDMYRTLSGAEAGLIGYWTFDAVTGDVAADWSDPNHGTVQGGAVWTVSSVPAPAAAGFGGALTFDGVDDYVVLDNGGAVRAWLWPSSC